MTRSQPLNLSRAGKNVSGRVGLCCGSDSGVSLMLMLQDCRGFGCILLGAAVVTCMYADT